MCFVILCCELIFSDTLYSEAMLRQACDYILTVSLFMSDRFSSSGDGPSWRPLSWLIPG